MKQLKPAMLLIMATLIFSSFTYVRLVHVAANENNAGDFCEGLKKIIKESENGYESVRFDKYEDEEDVLPMFYYKTNLPKIGFTDIKITEEDAPSTKNGYKKFYTCSLGLEFNKYDDAEKKFNKLISEITNCINTKGELKKESKESNYEIIINDNDVKRRIGLSLFKYESETYLQLEVECYSKK